MVRGDTISRPRVLHVQVNFSDAQPSQRATSAQNDRKNSMADARNNQRAAADTMRTAIRLDLAAKLPLSRQKIAPKLIARRLGELVISDLSRAYHSYDCFSRPLHQDRLQTAGGPSWGPNLGSSIRMSSVDVMLIKCTHRDATGCGYGLSVKSASRPSKCWRAALLRLCRATSAGSSRQREA